MLITCNGCNSKIRVPDTAAGKRVKCPKCATVIRVPDANPVSDEPEATGVSSTPLAPPPRVDPEPESEPGGTGVTSSGPKPPPIPATRSRGTVDDDDEFEDARPATKRRRKRDDEDDDDDDLSVRRRSVGRGRAVNNLATTSMVMGIVAVSISAMGMCCCPLITEPIALICGVTAIICGFMGRAPGSESTALTGIICGFASVGLAAIGFLIHVLIFGVHMGNFMVFNQNRRFR